MIKSGSKHADNHREGANRANRNPHLSGINKRKCYDRSGKNSNGLGEDLNSLSHLLKLDGRVALGKAHKLVKSVDGSREGSTKIRNALHR